MLSTYRAIVDDEGTIRLLEPVKLKEGTHILATVADRDTLIALMRCKTQPTPRNPSGQIIYAKCLCGCGRDDKQPTSRFVSGHDMRAKSMIQRAQRGRLTDDDRPHELIEAARRNPELIVQGFRAGSILKFFEDAVAINNQSTCSSAMLSTYRAIVDDDGTIRLGGEPVKLKEGTHILITVADRDSLTAPMRTSGQTGLSEERLREELQEDEAWAYLLKYVPS
jgi:predicted DNA-binding antitoxin AbrB/MazE fold protein